MSLAFPTITNSAGTESRQLDSLVVTRKAESLIGEAASASKGQANHPLPALAGHAAEVMRGNGEKME